MVTRFCPECGERKEITVTAQPVGRTGTAMRWRVVVHTVGQPAPDPIDGVMRRALCDGSGSLI